mgnify:CR=1 FL=1|tara:strand:+ start:185 stop:643 length:459 start_codon:yes stop_codon:yes gene_type:complete
MIKNLDIFVATMTGTALMVADEIEDFCKKKNMGVKTTEMDHLVPESFSNIINPILIVSSTYGQGDVPDGSKNFYNTLKSSNINLTHINYAIFGLGDMTYKDTFAYGGKKFDHLFLELKAKRIGDPYYHDASNGSLPEEEATKWFKDKIFNFL